MSEVDEYVIQANMTGERVIVTHGGEVTGLWLLNWVIGDTRLTASSLKLHYKDTEIGLDEVTALLDSDGILQFHISRDSEIYDDLDDEFEAAALAAIREAWRCFIRVEGSA